MFEAARPGCCFSVQQRAGSYFIKVRICIFRSQKVVYLNFFERNGFMWSNLQGILYASVGFACGLVGQGIANLIMTAKRYG